MRAFYIVYTPLLIKKTKLNRFCIINITLVDVLIERPVFPRGNLGNRKMTLKQEHYHTQIFRPTLVVDRMSMHNDMVIIY